MDAVTLVTLIAGIPYVGKVAVYVPIIITIGAAVGTMMSAPQSGSSRLYAFAYAVVQWCALNKGHAVNLNSPAVAGLVAGPGATSEPRMATESVPAPKP